MSHVLDLVTDRQAAATAVKHNADLRIWQFNGRYAHGIDIEAINQTLKSIAVVDQGSGSVPELFSMRRHIGLGVELRVYRTLLLDSNVARYLRSYVAGRLTNQLGEDVQRFLRWIATNDLEVHPGLSLMETVSGSDDPEFHGPELVKLTLLLSGMDSALFLDTGRLELRRAGIEHIEREFGTSDLDKAALIHFSRLPKSTSEVVDPTYAALLKIALIEHGSEHSSFGAKVDAFMDFLEHTLGAVLSVELIAAILFFAGRIRRFIPVLRQSPIEQRLQDIRSSAWDVFLARMTSAFIGEGDEDRLMLPFIATSDGRLKEILRAQLLRGVIKREREAPIPIIATDFEYLEGIAPAGWDSTSLETRLQNRRGVIARRGAITELVGSLEQEIAQRFS